MESDQNAVNSAQKKRLRQLEAIVKLHEVAYATEAQLANVAQEFFYKVGEILEGTPPDQITLKLIDQRAYHQALKRL